jgi:hypothetical protein
MDEAEKALNQYCPWWKTDPNFSFQVDTEKWSYDAVPIEKGIEVAKYIRDTMKKSVAAIYAPDWGYEGNIQKIKAAGFNWWSSEYRGSGGHVSIYTSNGGDNSHPGWRVVNGVTPVLNQYSDQGRVPGYGSNLVVSAFRGTVADFAEMIGSSSTPTTPPTTPPVTPPTEEDPLATIAGNEAQVLDKIAKAAAKEAAKEVWAYKRSGTLETDYEKDANGEFTTKRVYFPMDHFARYARDHAVRAKDSARDNGRELAALRAEVAELKALLEAHVAES